MNPRKAITTALLTAGLMVGGIGTAQVASAQYGDDSPAPATSTEADVSTQTNGSQIVQVQDEAEDLTEQEQDGETRHRGKKGCGKNYEAVAETIGIEVDALRDALGNGQSMADVAEDNGVDPQTVIDALVADAEERVEAKIAAGDITEEEAAEKLADKVEKINERVFEVRDNSSNEQTAAA